MDSAVLGSLIAATAGVIVAVYQVKRARKAKRDDDKVIRDAKTDSDRTARQDRMDLQAEARYDNLQQDLDAERLARQKDVAAEREARYKQVGQLEAQIQQQALLMERQGQMINILGTDIRVRDDYIMQLRQDIADGKPPPPRAWPVSLTRGTTP